MSKIKYYFLGIVVIILLGLSAGYAVFKKEKEESFKLSDLENVLNATSTVAVTARPEIKEISKTGELSLYKGQDVADIGNDAFISKVPKEQVDKYKAELIRLRGVLEKNPLNVDAWMGVGNIKNFFGNYDGARDAWEYTGYLNDGNSVVYYNLGNLYGSYLKDYKKAEENFLKAIELENRNVNYYIGAADFYRNFYTEKKAEVKKILEEGIRQVPNDVSILAYAGGYYKEEGNKERALELFKKALELYPQSLEIKEEVERLQK